MSSLESHYSARDIEAKIIAALHAAGLDPDQRLTPEELAALDHFHTGGLRATNELLEAANIRPNERVLDIGAGLAGSARFLAFTVGAIARVLKPDGRYVFQEMAAGEVATSYYPLPWASDPAHNCLASGEEMCSILSACGFWADLFEDMSVIHLGRSTANATPAATGQLGLGVFECVTARHRSERSSRIG